MSISQLITDITEKNLSSALSDDKLATLGQKCMKLYALDRDDPKRVEWAKHYDEYIDIAMQIIENKSTPWAGCANIKIPLLIEAMIQFNARAMPSLIPSTNIVKCATTGEDAEGVKSERGERIGKHMSYQLTTEMTEWVDDMDRGLLIISAVGSFFKKSFYNPDLGRNESRLVLSKDVIVKFDAPSIDRVPRISEPVWFYPYEVKEKMRNGTWTEQTIDYDDEEEEKLEKFITQHTYLDVIRENIEMMVPYIVTFHEKTGTIVRITANYTKKSIKYEDDKDKLTTVQAEMDLVDGQNQQIDTANFDSLVIAQKAGNKPPEQMKEVPYPDFDDYKALRVESTKYYTQFGFLPSPDKSLYYIGLGQLLAPLSDSADTLVNQMLDAGTASLRQGGFKAKSAKMASGKKEVDITEWTDVETSGMALKESLLPFNFPGPSAVAFNLLSFLIDTGKSVANLKDILSGDTIPNQPATTSLIQREEGMRIYTAIYQRLYRALKFELSKLYDLNAEWLPQELYYNILDTKEAIKKKDYSFDKTDVLPTADPNEATQSQRILKAEALMPLKDDPRVNGDEIIRRWLVSMDTPNIDEVLTPPEKRKQPPPDPDTVKTIAEVSNIEADTEKIKEDTVKKKAETLKIIADAEAVEMGPQLKMYEKEADFLREGLKNGAKQAGSEGVEGEPGNQGSIPEPQGTDIGIGELGGTTPEL